MTVVGGSGGELGSLIVWGGFFVFWGVLSFFFILFCGLQFFSYNWINNYLTN